MNYPPQRSITRLVFVVHILVWFICISPLYSQNALEIIPQKPSQQDSVVIVFHADKGNAGLANHSGDIYFHTGVITNESSTPTSWKYVKGNWGIADSALKMQYQGNKTYTLAMHPRSFYGIPSQETILRLAFVMRNADGTKVGKDASDQDFYIDFPASDSVKSGNESLMQCLYSNTSEAIENQYCEGYYQDSLGLIINMHKGKISIEYYGDNIFRVSYDSISLPPIKNPYSIVMNKQYAQFIVVDFGEYFQFRLIESEYSIHVQKYPVRISFVKGNTIIAKESAGLFEQSPGKAVSFSLTEGEGIFGGGSRALPFNKRGLAFPLYNTPVYGYANGAEQLNISIPFFVSSNNYGVFIDSHLPGAADCGSQSSNILKIALESGTLSYFMILGNSQAQISSSYASLTGKQPLPPSWALGFIQSKYGYKNQKEAEEIVERLQKADMPLDALVLDLFWFGNKESMGNLDWDKTQWQNPEAMVSAFNQKGVKTILITEPYFTLESTLYKDAAIKGLFAKKTDGSPYILNDFWAGKSSLLDLTNPKAQTWMSQFYSKQMRLGIGGWWCDLGEPEMHPKDMVHILGKASDIHNIYSMFWMDMLHTTYAKEMPDTRLFNLIRSGTSGMQRYSAFPWSGDVQRSASGLKAQIPIMLSMGLNGVAYMHSDLGGFTGGARNDELYIRWLQFGAFTPIMRAHGEGVPSEPVNYPDSVLSIVRFFAKIRMQFFPYNYSLAWQNTKKGYPIARPIFWNDIPAKEFMNVNDEYLWGDNILIAPVLEPNISKRTIILPKGNWFDFWTNIPIPGYSNFEMPVPLSILPIFIRGGSIIPFANPMKSTQHYRSDSLTIVYFRDTSSLNNEFELYTDNGKSANALNDSAYRVLSIHTIEDTVRHSTSMTISTKEGRGFIEEPSTKIVTLKVVNVQSVPTKITLSNKSILIVNNEKSFFQSTQPIAWHKQSQNPNAPNELLIRYAMNKEKAPTLLIEHGASHKSKK